MGCFSAQKSPDESPPTLKSFLATKQHPLPTARQIAEKTYCLITPKALKARARLLRSVARLTKNRPRALSLKTAGPRDHHAEPNAEHFISHSAPILLEANSRATLPESGFSGPIHAMGSHTNFQDPSLKPPLLFPLPLPPGHVSSQSNSSTLSSFSSASFSIASSRTKGSHLRCSSLPGDTCFSEPMPLPPPNNSKALREFSLEELVGACQNFNKQFRIRDGDAGPVYRVIVKENSDDENGTEVYVTRLVAAKSNSFKKWKADVQSLARLAHPHLCKVIGCSSQDGKCFDQETKRLHWTRLLVYESTAFGSLDGLLYNGRKLDRTPIDWCTRSRIALGAAEGLAFLHDRTPKQIIYRCFKTSNVQVDSNFDAKLSDYGFNARTSTDQRSYTDDPTMDDAYLAPETKAGDGQMVTDKSNVWGFGMMLLELLTGRQNLDQKSGPEERELAKWAGPCLRDARRLILVMDPELKGRYPVEGAKVVGDLALRCLQNDPSQRPTMREAASVLSALQASPFANPESFLLVSPSNNTMDLKKKKKKKKKSQSFG